MPNPEKSVAFNEGFEAGFAGFNDLDNPYEIGSDDAMDWEDGRMAYEDGKLLDEQESA